MKQKPIPPERSISLRLTFRIRRGSEVAFGPGKADLLEFIAQTGSINQAAKRMGMSYMRAWSLVQTMNRCFMQPLVAAAPGGTGGGGAKLTQAGHQTLSLYRQVELKANQATQILRKKIRSQLKS